MEDSKSPLLMPRTEARVTIHRPSETIVISGEVEIAPAVVSHKGLTITTVNAQSPNSQEGSHRARLQDLVDAMNQLRVPAADRITIIRKLHETGRLHATLIVED